MTRTRLQNRRSSNDCCFRYRCRYRRRFSRHFVPFPPCRRHRCVAPCRPARSGFRTRPFGLHGTRFVLREYRVLNVRRGYAFVELCDGVCRRIVIVVAIRVLYDLLHRGCLLLHARVGARSFFAAPVQIRRSAPFRAAGSLCGCATASCSLTLHRSSRARYPFVVS